MHLRALFILAVLAAVLASEEHAFAQDQVAVPASAILAEIAQGRSVLCQGVNIAGDLNLSALPDARARSSLEIINCKVSDANFVGVTFDKDVVLMGTSFGRANFDQAVFLEMADLSNTTFEDASFNETTFRKLVIFDGALFRKKVSFEDTQFNEDASYAQSSFLGDADFNYSAFESYCYFSSARFQGSASFSDVTFRGVSDFSLSNFSGKACFIRSRFEEAASFSDAFFGGLAQFGLSRFQALSSFGSAVFSGEANFNLARFEDAAYFSEAQFKGNALFGLTKFDNTASFQEAYFGGDLILKGAHISTVLLERGGYGPRARIILNDTDFVRLRAPWKEIGNRVVWDPGAYLALIQNYHTLGWSADEDDCYYKYRRLSQAEKPPGWSKAIDVLAWLSCGYGVRPGYAVVWSILTILAFALVFWRGDGIRRSAKPLQGTVEEDSVPERATLRNALFFSTMVFLSQGPIDFLPVARNRYYVILEGIMGWLLLALFLVTLGRVMIR